MGRKLQPPRLKRMYKKREFYILDRRKQIPTNTTDGIKAGMLLAEYIQDEALKQKTPQRQPEAITVAQIFDFYVEEHVNTPEVVDRQRIMKAIKAIGLIEVFSSGRQQRFVNLFLVELCRDIFRQYARYRAAGPGTIRYELTIIRSALNHSVKEERIKKSDLPYIELPDAPKKKKRWLRNEEAKKLISSCSGRCRLFIYIALGSCGRKEAIENLKWEQVDFKNRFINLDPGDDTPETDKRKASMRFSDFMWGLLQHEYSVRTSIFVLGSNSDIRPAFNTAVARAGLKGVTPHVLRHTAATWMAQDGCTPYQIAGALGDSVETVIENYMHFAPEHLQKPAETLNTRLIEISEQRQV